MRRIIQICGSDPNALCDDGTVWYYSAIQEKWCKLPDIPQDKPHENKITFEKISQERND